MADLQRGGKKVFGYGLRGQGIIRMARNELGQFTSMQVEVRAAHRRMAERVQQDVVNAFQASLDREEDAQKKQQYLRKALSSDKALRYNLDGFVYLPAGYLDRSGARRYWRFIEHGTNIFVGRELRGFFRSLEGKTSGPSHGRQGRDAYMPQIKKKVSKAKLKKAASGKFVKGIGHKIVIRNPIQPHRFLENGIATFEARNFVETAYNEAFAQFSSYRRTKSGSAIRR